MRVTKANLTAHVAATDDSRPVLNSIFVDPKRMQTVSADGFRLLAVPLPPQDEGENGIPAEGAMLSLDHALRAAKVIPNKPLPTGERDRVFVHVNGDGRATVKIEHPDAMAELQVPLVTGAYPNYQTIIGNAEKNVTGAVALDIKLLLELLTQMKVALGRNFGSNYPAVVFYFGEPSHPVVIKTVATTDDDKTPAATAVLMPMHMPDRTKIAPIKLRKKGGWVVAGAIPTEV